MKILYIDPISPLGHINFNKLQIESLLKEGFEIDYIFKEGYANYLQVESSRVVVELKKYNRTNGLLNRWNLYRNSLLIKKWIKAHPYDKIIFSSFDEIILALTNIKSYLFLINHNNCIGLTNSKLKLWAYKKISKHSCQLVMDSDSINLLHNLGIGCVKQINHGLVKPFDSLMLPEEYRNLGKIVFVPSPGNDKLFHSVVEDLDFLDFLEKNNVTILIKKLNGEINHKRIKSITHRLTDEDYRGLIMNSSFIILNYPKTFKYRTSGVLLECIVNDKPVLASSAMGLKAYEKIIGVNSYFKDIEDFKNKFQSLFIEETSIQQRIDFQRKNRGLMEANLGASLR